jgi:hypothetical protein
MATSYAHIIRGLSKRLHLRSGVGGGRPYTARKEPGLAGSHVQSTKLHQRVLHRPFYQLRNPHSKRSEWLQAWLRFLAG